MPLGEGSGGSFGAVVGRSGGQGGGMSGQQQAAMNWLQGASGMNLANYNSSMGALGAQQNAANAMYGAASGAAGRDYGLAMRGIDLDLRYGNQLRDQESYRNVDLGRMRSNVDLGNADRNWGITQGDINRRVGFAGRGFGLANRGVQAQYNTGMRSTASDAVARGARTAAGTLQQFGDLAGGRNRGLAENKLGYDTTLSGLRTERQRGSQANTYAHQQHGIDKRTFDSLAKTYGIQAAQALDQAALARARAGANRASASGSAGAQRMSALASLSGQQNSAFQNYFNNQMGLASQLYGM